MGTAPGDVAPEQALATIKASLAHTSKLSWSECLCPADPRHRRIVAVALLLGVAQQLTGTEAVLYYLPQVLSNLSPYWKFIGNLGVGTAKLVGELVAAALVSFSCVCMLLQSPTMCDNHACCRKARPSVIIMRAAAKPDHV